MKITPHDTSYRLEAPSLSQNMYYLFYMTLYIVKCASYAPPFFFFRQHQIFGKKNGMLKSHCHKQDIKTEQENFSFDYVSGHRHEDVDEDCSFH